jgi:hypothetical protein
MTVKENTIFIKYLPWVSRVLSLILTCIKTPGVTDVWSGGASSKFRFGCHPHIKFYHQPVQCMIGFRCNGPSFLQNICHSDF